MRLMRKSDLAVAPYNAQVNARRTALPEDIRVGTVDKFPGQEAPVCLVSKTASSAEDIPRGLEFLYSTNRIILPTASTSLSHAPRRPPPAGSEMRDGRADTAGERGVCPPKTADETVGSNDVAIRPQRYC